MLDPSKYAVTNLGACGSTMQKGADSPYWKRPQFQTLIASKWDVLVVMLGTNDAKDKVVRVAYRVRGEGACCCIAHPPLSPPQDGGPTNWGCGTGANVTLGCQFAEVRAGREVISSAFLHTHPPFPLGLPFHDRAFAHARTQWRVSRHLCRHPCSSHGARRHRRQPNGHRFR